MLSATGMEDTTKTQAAPCRAPVNLEKTPDLAIEQVDLACEEDEDPATLPWPEYFRNTHCQVPVKWPDTVKECHAELDKLKGLLIALDNSIGNYQEMIVEGRENVKRARIMAATAMEDKNAAKKLRDLRRQHREQETELKESALKFAEKDLELSKLKGSLEDWQQLYYGTLESENDKEEQARFQAPKRQRSE